MLTLREPGPPASRRDLLRAGGLGLLGLSLPELLRAETAGRPAGAPASFGRAKHVLYLFLSGGPSQYETFDPKPDAPAEIRGTFKPIPTRVPGVHFCELLPRLAAIADRFAVVRSMATDDPNHESAGYWVHTGYKYAGPNMRSVSPTDWPTVGSVVKMLRPSEAVPPFSSVMLPEPIVANPNVFLPGQNAGFLGPRWDPETFKCDPTAAQFQVEGLAPPPDLPAVRLTGRDSLMRRLDDPAWRQAIEKAAPDYDRPRQDALSVLLSGRVREAFALDREPAKVRDRYGRGKWGQSVLLARRLIEAGVRMAFVNWPREPGDLQAGNPLWDTHSDNDKRMKNVLCPQLDLGLPALLEDLDQRGLLSETLVVAVGEMGRTPRFNPSGGRDHWGGVYSFALAGAGVAVGQAHGASDKTGSHPVAGRVQPSDLAATIFHLLGVGSEATFPDRLGRPHRVTDGEPIRGVLL